MILPPLAAFADNPQGQATLELSVSATLLVLTLTLGGLILRAEWERTECARWVFEVARRKLEGGVTPRLPADIRIEVREDPEAWSADGRCGRSREAVSLRKLEPILRDKETR
jgi:hypothetical protein